MTVAHTLRFFTADEIKALGKQSMENVTPDSSHSFQGTPFGDWLQGAVGGDLADLSKTQCVGSANYVFTCVCVV